MAMAPSPTPPHGVGQPADPSRRDVLRHPGRAIDVSGMSFWPLWIAGPWGAIMIGRWVSGSHPGGGPGHPNRLPPPNRPNHPNHPRRMRGDHPDQIGGDSGR